MEEEVVLFGDNRTELLGMYLMGREGTRTEEWRHAANKNLPVANYLSTYLPTKRCRLDLINIYDKLLF